MIVVIGLPAYVGSADGEGSAGGLAVDVAVAAHLRGSAVELAGKVGDDGAGDAVVVALGRLGVGHAALLRDPARPTPVFATPPIAADDAEAEDGGEAEATILPADPAQRPALEAADVELALRYVTGSRVVVVADPLAEDAVEAAAEGAAFAGARLVVLVPTNAAPPAVPAEATVLEAPAQDDGSFGRLVGAFAAGLDGGLEPAAAFSRAVEAAGWEAVAD